MVYTLKLTDDEFKKVSDTLSKYGFVFDPEDHYGITPGHWVKEVKGDGENLEYIFPPFQGEDEDDSNEYWCFNPSDYEKENGADDFYEFETFEDLLEFYEIEFYEDENGEEGLE